MVKAKPIFLVQLRLGVLSLEIEKRQVDSRLAMISRLKWIERDIHLCEYVSHDECLWRWNVFSHDFLKIYREETAINRFHLDNHIFSNMLIIEGFLYLMQFYQHEFTSYGKRSWMNEWMNDRLSLFT